MGYPFFLASLPDIRPGAAPAWTSARFLEEAARNLSAPDFAVLAALASDASCGHPFVLAWRSFDTQLRNACARARAARRGLDAKPFLRPHEECDGALDRRVQAVFQSAPDPFAREQALDALRLERLASLPEDPFSLDAVLAYYLRLRIAERIAAPDPEAGRARLRSVVAGATTDAENEGPRTDSTTL